MVFEQKKGKYEKEGKSYHSEEKILISIREAI